MYSIQEQPDKTVKIVKDFEGHQEFVKQLSYRDSTLLLNKLNDIYDDDEIQEILEDLVN